MLRTCWSNRGFFWGGRSLLKLLKSTHVRTRLIWRFWKVPNTETWLVCSNVDTKPTLVPTGAGQLPSLAGWNHWFQFQFQFQLVKHELELGLSFGTSSTAGTGSAFWNQFYTWNWVRVVEPILELELGLSFGTSSRWNWVWFLEPVLELKPGTKFLFHRTETGTHNFLILFGGKK